MYIVCESIKEHSATIEKPQLKFSWGECHAKAGLLTLRYSDSLRLPNLAPSVLAEKAKDQWRQEKKRFAKQTVERSEHL
jgi:hypothetical protein